jgi:hypothetical protein
MTRHALPGLLLVLLTTFASRHADACAGCRNPSMPVSRGSEGPLAQGALRAAASLMATTVHVKHEAGCRDLGSCGELPVQPAYIHDQRLYPAELRVSAEYGFTSRFGLELQVPFRVVKTTIEYTTLDGQRYDPLDPGIHHRNETVAGPADPWLLYRVGTSVEKWWLALRSGFSLPIGRTEEDPFELGDHGLRHQHIQLGSGTFDPVGVVEASRKFGDYSFALFAQGQGALYQNRHGFRAPARVYGGGSLGHELVGDLSGTLGIEAFHETSERWHGVERQDGNLGRSELLAAGSLSLTIEETELSLSARAAFFRHIVTGTEAPGTLSSPVTLGLSVARVFELAPHDSE